MTRILAIETIGRTGTVALSGDDGWAEYSLPAGSRSAQSLAAAIAALMRLGDRRLDEVDLVAVAVGPGSFTGLRVGVTTAKVLAYALGRPVLGIGTLRALAWQAATPGAVSAALDAERGQLFAATFDRQGDQLAELSPPAIVEPEAWLASLTQAGATATGPALVRLRERHRPWAVSTAPVELWPLRARAVGELAQFDFEQGLRHDPFALLPEYLRESYAEERHPL